MDTITYDPFGWRLAEEADPATPPERRADLASEMLVLEAEELAHGRRHLTIRHGEPRDLAEAAEIDGFYDAVRSQSVEVAGCRLAGGSSYLTVTVPAASESLLDDIADRVLRERRLWRIVASPLP